MEDHKCLDSVRRSMRRKAECEDTETDLWRETWEPSEPSSAYLAFLSEERINMSQEPGWRSRRKRFHKTGEGMK